MHSQPEPHHYQLDRLASTSSGLHPQPERRLYQPAELPGLLQLTQEQVDHLIRTGQILKIRICGEERVDSRQIDQLISTYKQVSERKNQVYVQ